jgi:hypothetical protein
VSVDTPRTAAAEQDVDWLSADQLHEWQALVTLLMTLPAAMDGQLRRDAGVNLFEYHVLAPEQLSALADAAGAITAAVAAQEPSSSGDPAC